MSNYPLSPFGKRLCAPAGIVSLMDDLGEALNNNPDILFLGGGNPARIPEVEAALAGELAEVAESADRVHKLLGVYQSPRGHEGFISQIVAFLNAQCGWSITERNVALSNGSQSAFFTLMNMLAVPSHKKENVKRIHLPMAPEYLGYSGQTIHEDMFVAHRPLIELDGERGFHYRVGIEALSAATDVAAYCVSMPTNPTGNVLDADELAQVQRIAQRQGVPLIIDCAYGVPIPGIVHKSVELPWSSNSVFMFSLSKLGLPGVRTGIIVGPEPLVDQFINANTVACLANGNLGPVLVESLMAQHRLEPLINQAIKPFYRSRRDFMLQALAQALEGLPCRVHRADGAFFVWLWLEGLPITAQDLYLVLKSKGVLIMPGEPFFFGLKQPWSHSAECIRLSYCQTESVLEQAVSIVGAVIRELYEGK